MPRYRLEWRQFGSSDEWTGSRVIDTGDVVPSAASPWSESITGLTNGQQIEVRVLRLLSGDSVGPSTPVGRATPSRFDIDWTDGFEAGINLGWTDGRGGRYYRVDRWTTATDTPAAGEVTSVSLDLNGGSGPGSKTTSLTGLTNGTTYRLRVHRLSGAGGSVTRSSSIVTAAPVAGFESTDGYTGLGPSTASAGGELKAQFATDGTNTGILVSLKNNGYASVAVSFVAADASPAGTVTTISWTSSANFTSQNIGTTFNTGKSYFVRVASARFPVTIPGTSPAQNGARVVLTSQGGQATTFTVTPTYVL